MIGLHTNNSVHNTMSKRQKNNVDLVRRKGKKQEDGDDDEEEER